jgi:hypothetical protein
MVARGASEASEASDLYDSEPDFDDDILVARKGELQEVGPLLRAKGTVGMCGLREDVSFDMRSLAPYANSSVVRDAEISHFS